MPRVISDPRGMIDLRLVRSVVSPPGAAADAPGAAWRTVRWHDPVVRRHPRSAVSGMGPAWMCCPEPAASPPELGAVRRPRGLYYSRYSNRVARHGLMTRSGCSSLFQCESSSRRPSGCRFFRAEDPCGEPAALRCIGIAWPSMPSEWSSIFHPFGGLEPETSVTMLCKKRATPTRGRQSRMAVVARPGAGDSMSMGV